VAAAFPPTWAERASTSKRFSRKCSARKVAAVVARGLAPVATSLHCADELAAVANIPRDGGSYQRQRRVAEVHDGDLRAVVDALAGELDTSTRDRGRCQ
jgi:gamma-glutamyl:cysteine ligase YbdK (ATP-grasp superfamily)